MKRLHISTVRKILEAPEPVDLKVWKKDGTIMLLRDVVSLKYNFYQGTRQIKILKSNQIRTIRDCLIFSLNDCEVIL